MKIIFSILMLTVTQAAFASDLTCDVTQVLATETKLLDMKTDTFTVNLEALTEAGVSRNAKLGNLVLKVRRPDKTTGLNAVIVSLSKDTTEASSMGFPHLSDSINSINCTLSTQANKETLASEISCYKN
jgi:hypothetical protein